jgi:hypothetical protein
MQQTFLQLYFTSWHNIKFFVSLIGKEKRGATLQAKVVTDWLKTKISLREMLRHEIK